MALTGSDRGTGTHSAGATSLTLSPSANFAAGSWAALAIAVDNAGGGGAAMSTFTVTDSLGNTWTRRVSPLYDPGTASSGVEGAIFTTDQDAGVLQTGTVITVTFNTSPVAKAWNLHEVAPGAGNGVAFVTGGVNTGAATAAPTVTTGSIASGDMVIGALFNEAGTTQTVTGDADTTNGTWSARMLAQAGSTTSGMVCSSQRKVTTGAGTQTFNPGLGISSDVILGWIQLHETVNYTGSVSETVAVSEALGASYEAIADVSESVAIDELVGEVYTPTGGGGTAYTADIGESIAVTEAISSTLAAVVTPSESVAVSESTSALFGAVASPTETVTVTESIAPQRSAVAGVSEAVVLSESLSGGLQFTSSVGEVVTVSESLASRIGAAAVVADAVAIAEQLGVAGSYAAALGDAVAIAEAMAGGQAYTAGVGETIAVSEAVAAMWSSLVAVAESIALADAVSIPALDAGLGGATAQVLTEPRPMASSLPETYPTASVIED